MNGEEAQEVIRQLRQEIAKLQDQQRLYEKTTQEKEELKAALLKAESELKVCKASLFISNAKYKGLEKAVMESQSDIPDSCLPEEGSREESGVQEPPRSAGSDLPAAGLPSKRQSEASQEEPPRKRVVVPGTSRQAESGRSPVEDRATQTVDLDAIARDREEAERHPNGWGALHSAACMGDGTTMRELLARGFDPRILDHDGRTPLHWVLIMGRGEAAHMVVEADGGNDIEDKDGWTPLQWAATYGHAEIVRKLVAAGARLRHQTKFGRTALHCALYYEQRTAAQLLMELDDRANSIPDNDGATPLHMAAQKGFADIVKQLLSSGACPHAKNRRGEYPLYLAASDGHDDCVKPILAVYAWRGIEVNEVEVFRPSRLSSLDPHRIQHCRDLLSECEAEIQWMKETRVAGSIVSYHDFATRHVSGAAMCLRNEGVREELLSDRVALDFPIYADLIGQRVRRAEEKRVLLHECLECLSVLFRKFPPLPPSCFEIVLRCLTEGDMKSVVKAAKFC